MKKLNSVIAVALILSAPAARAELSAEDCRLIGPGARQATILPGAPSYFAKPLGFKGKFGAWGAWIGPDGNRVTRIDGTVGVDGLPVSIRVPGDIDPVWAPPKANGEVRWLTLPGITWYRADEILAAAANGEDADGIPAAYEDRALSGVYQSIALLADGETYRVITEEGGVAAQLYFRDYREGVDPAGVLTIRPVSDPREICPGKALKLPMVSKTGAMLAGYNPETSSTQVFQVNDDLSCDLVFDLGRPTGKVEFAFDDSRIAFHVDGYIKDLDMHGGWFSGVSDNIVRNVFVAKISRNGTGLQVDGVSRLTKHVRKGDGAYYPAFYREGTQLRVAYLTAQAPASAQPGLEDGKIYAFETIDADSGNYSPYLFGDQGDPVLQASMVLLGGLWLDSCQRHVPQPEGGEVEKGAADASLLPMSMSPKGCRRLVSEAFEANAQRVIGALVAGENVQVDPGLFRRLTAETLLAACPKTGKDGTTVEVGPLVSHVRTAADVVRGSCRDCHLGGGNGPRQPGEAKPFDFDLFFRPVDQLDASQLHESEEWLDASIHAIQSGHMPVGAELGTAERRSVMDHLNQRRLDIRRRKRDLGD